MSSFRGKNISYPNLIELKLVCKLSNDAIDDQGKCTIKGMADYFCGARKSENGM